MTDKDLDRVYSLKDEEALTRFYDDWAEGYDASVEGQGYATPARVARALTEAGADTGAPILDIGCGTGLSGAALAEAGFTAIHGADLSAGMLAVADRRGIYAALFHLPGDRPATPYDSIAATGVISPGAAPASFLFDCLAMLAPGGLLGFSFNGHALADPSYPQALDRALGEGRAEKLSESEGDHLPGIGLRSTVYVLRRC